MPDDPTPTDDDRLTVVFADDAHEAFEDYLIGRAAAGYHVRLDGTAVQLDGYSDGHLHYHHVDDHHDPVGGPQRLALRDANGLLTVTHVEIL